MNSSIRWAIFLALLAGCHSASAAEVFAEPIQAKGKHGGYSLTAFSDGTEDGFSFTIDLPKGLKGVDVSKCGQGTAGVAARCLYEPSTGKLAVVAFRLDGRPMPKGEISLGQVVMPRSSLAKLAPIEAGSVNSAKRSRTVDLGSPERSNVPKR